MTVLDALNEIREKQDSSLAYRHSCGMGICGSCGMVINRTPMLACRTQISTLAKGKITIEPMYGMTVVKDLVTILEPFFTKHKLVMPYIKRKDLKEREDPRREYKVTTKELDRFLQFDYCIVCGLCNSACPTVALDPLFLGPQALGQAYRYIADPRDEGWSERLDAVDSAHGIWRCHFAGACSSVCPKGVDPAKAIQMEKRELLKKRLFIRRSKVGAGLVETPPPPSKPKNVQKPPPFDFSAGESSQ
jgi:succinate dehydrogenase / fumarate reductase iron-sulfur subunit